MPNTTTTRKKHPNAITFIKSTEVIDAVYELDHAAPWLDGDHWQPSPPTTYRIQSVNLELGGYDVWVTNGVYHKMYCINQTVFREFMLYHEKRCTILDDSGIGIDILLGYIDIEDKRRIAREEAEQARQKLIKEKAENDGNREITGRLLIAMNEATIKARDALGRYKFDRFGYWAAAWVRLNHIAGNCYKNPFKDLVDQAKANK